IDDHVNGKKSIKELLEAIYPQSDKEEYILKLEPIAGNQNAVYQYLSKEDNLPPSSRSPNHTTKDSWRHYHSNSQEPYMEEVHEEPEEPTEEACDKDLAPCKCLICNRTYRVRGHLRRHLWTVHKIVSSGSTTNSSDSTSSSKKMPNGKVPDNPNTSPSSLSDTQNQKSPKEDKVSSKAQFSIGFDFKACFCKLCRRTFMPLNQCTTQTLFQ
uniref:C2H2-type domain-containing protein n=1 Tax=Sinocyclocheilus rhinocerous TaxID=307959 RepID=A0A673FGI5_9TELE